MSASGSRPSRQVRVGGLVLAAGAGGGPEASAGAAGVDGGGSERPVDRAVRVLGVGGADPVVVVLDAAGVDVPGADEVVVDEGWAEGTGSGLAAGLACPAFARCTAVLVHTVLVHTGFISSTRPRGEAVEQPGIRATAVRRGREAHAAGADLAVATYAGEWGEPVLLGRGHWSSATQAPGADGIAEYVMAHAHEVVEVPCDTGARDTGRLTAAAGGGILRRIAADTGGAGAPLGAGLEALTGLLGGSGARARAEEKAAEVVRRDVVEAGEPPLTEVDLAAGVARIRTDRR